MSSHGSCNGCGKGFGMFKKEEACHNCGLSFCSKCVGTKIAIPKLGGKVDHVCVRCCKIIQGLITDTTAQRRDVSPPANFLRNLEATQKKQVQSGARKESLKKKGLTADPVVKRHLKPEYRNLSKEDMAIAERLEKLKEDRKELELGPSPLPPIQDVEQRLARLKGDPEADSKAVNAPSGTVHPHIPPTKPKTEQEETNDLLNQVTDEVNIDSKVSGKGAPANTSHTTASAKPATLSADDIRELADVQSLIAQAANELEIDASKAVDDLKKDKEIMARLKDLRAKRGSKSEDVHTSQTTGGADTSGELVDSSDDEESQVKTIVQQALEERRLDEQLEAEGGFKPSLRKEKTVDLPLSQLEEVDPDELPWCCICNEDATIRCLGCDMDLYCRRCYKDGHKQLYDEQHEFVPYKQNVSRDAGQTSYT